MIRLALQLPTLIPNAIPLLRRGSNRSISLSQQQVACLLANAFFCTFPRRNDRGYGSEYGNYPSINFNSLFFLQNEWVYEKIKCIIHYFRRVCKQSKQLVHQLLLLLLCLIFKINISISSAKWCDHIYSSM